MGKINLAKQNQYVEFAEKDNEGNSISQAFKTIEEAIDSKIGFNSVVSVETIGGDKGIKKANLPTTAGTYKLSSGGILTAKVNSESSITITAMYGASMYAETRDPASTSNFLFNENTRLGEKPIYWHSVAFTRGGDGSSYERAFGQIVVLNNSPAPITAQSFIELLKIEGFFAQVNNGQFDLTSGSNFSNMGYLLVGITYSTETAFNVHLRDKGTNAYSIMSLYLEGFTVNDQGVNRIN